MLRSKAQRFAIARAVTRRKAAAANDVTTAPGRTDRPRTAAPTANAPQEIHLDLQSATMREGRTARGQVYVSFQEGGQPVVMGFGLVAEAMKRDRLAKGMAVRERGMLKVVALRSGDSLLDERGDHWRRAA